MTPAQFDATWRPAHRRTFVGSNPKPHLLCSSSSRFKCHLPVDDGTPITFKWHWPKGTFDKRMSAYDIAEFILPDMVQILRCGFLNSRPRVRAEFAEMLHKLADITTTIVTKQFSVINGKFVNINPVAVQRYERKKKAVIDRLLPWIKPQIGTEEDDIIYMQIDAKLPQPVGPTYFT